MHNHFSDKMYKYLILEHDTVLHKSKHLHFKAFHVRRVWNHTRIDRVENSLVVVSQIHTSVESDELNTKSRF